MEPPEESYAASPHNGEGPGGDQQKLGLGLGFESLDVEGEDQYEQNLREEIEELVLGEQRLERERLGEIDEGFDDNNDGGMNTRGYNGNQSYPVRPDVEDCPYYMRVGSCKYGSGCKFNHPLNRRNLYPKAAKDKEDYYSQRPVKVECKYYMTSGGCKHGKACRFSHSRAKTAAAPVVEFNFLGLPIRLGEMECSFYMRNGTCKYGSNCRFNHPEPTAVGVDAPSGYVDGRTVSLQAAPQTTMSSWSSPKSVNGNVPMLPVVYSPTNGAPAPNLEWRSYQAPVYPATERRLPTPPAFMLNNPTETNFYTHHKLPMLGDEFPERPGEPDCSYFMKTGDCKYRSGCKFHHPKSRMPKSAPCALSDKGLPLRPDQPVCSYYTRYGLCKYGPACRYDHPVHDDNSTSTVSGQNCSPSFGSSGVDNGGENGENTSYVSQPTRV